MHNSKGIIMLNLVIFIMRKSFETVVAAKML